MELSSSQPSVDAGALDRYLDEIGRVPLIDRDEEARLARGIREGRSECLERLVRANLRFVVSVATKYQNLGVPLPDLINEGNLGLIRAARRFDETRGTRFVSYAVWWIRQAILQALAEQGRIVRVPPSRAGVLHRIGRRAAALRQELGREPTAEELARDLDLSVDEVAETLAVARPPLSLDGSSSSADEQPPLLDRLPDPRAPAPESRVHELARRKSVEAALATLGPREAKVLRLYFGFDAQEPMTLDQIGAALGVTRARVRQIKERALRRLRHESRARFLEPYDE